MLPFCGARHSNMLSSSPIAFFHAINAMAGTTRFTNATKTSGQLFSAPGARGS